MFRLVLWLAGAVTVTVSPLVLAPFVTMGWLASLISSRSVTLVSALPPTECSKRLRKAVPETEGIWGSSPVVGWIEKDGASFERRAQGLSGIVH